MIAIPRLLSPSVVSPVPRLQAEFLDHWAGALDSSELINREYRGVLQDLVKTKARVSVFADTLFFALAEGWLRAQGRGGPCSLRANQVLEFTLPTESIPGDWISISSQLRPHGFDLLHAEWAARKDATVRIPSLSFMSSALRSCFGDQALLPCFAKGEVSSQDAVDLHKEGYHSLGLSNFYYALHDLMHLVFWSANVPLWMQTAAFLWCETCEENLEDAALASTRYSARMIVGDLELRRWDISRPMRVLADSLSDSAEGKRLVRILLERYLRKLDDHFKDEKPADLIDHRRKVEGCLP